MTFDNIDALTRQLEPTFKNTDVEPIVLLGNVFMQIEEHLRDNKQEGEHCLYCTCYLKKQFNVKFNFSNNIIKFL